MLTRQVVLDARGRIFGYELQQPPGARDAESLLHIVSQADAALTDKRAIFVRCGPETLAAGHLDLVDPEQVVVRVELPAFADGEKAVQIRAALADVAARGVRLCLDHRAFTSAWNDWLPHAWCLWVDVAALPEAALKQVVKMAQARDALKLIAAGVTTPEQFKSAAAMGFTLFQGDWFAKPAPVKAKSLQPGHATILQLIHMVRTEGDPASIEEVLKRDPALSFNLLRFVNSTGMGLNCEITSFRHAVMILGLKKLFRWASLLVATARTGAAPAVGQTAVVRGRLMELLASDLLAPDECDNAFVVGIFSLLETMTGLPLARALEGIALPDSVLQALHERKGPLAPFLDLAMACEREDDVMFAHFAQRLHLTDRQVNMAHLNSLVWAEELLAGD
jgi:c-di-GMP-related signal transduction protein